MSNLDKMAVECQNQTNCSLERYNQVVNDLFPTKEPNLLQFAAGILKEAQDWTKFLIDSITPTIIKNKYQTAAVKFLPSTYKSTNAETTRQHNPCVNLTKNRTRNTKRRVLEEWSMMYFRTRTCQIGEGGQN